MEAIIKIRRFFKKNYGIVELWETSAICTWPEVFIERVLSKKVHVIVAEGTIHELSAGRHHHEVCRKLYYFIMDAKKTGLIIIDVPKTEMMAMPIDDQIVIGAYERYRKGYNITLVTCDVDQASKAENRGVNVQLLKGNKEQQSSKILKPKQTTIKKEEDKPKKIEEVDGELVIPCITKGNVIYINVRQGVIVYDAKGKRKIGRDNLIAVSIMDILVYREQKYMIQSTTDTYINLKRIDST